MRRTSIAAAFTAGVATASAQTGYPNQPYVRDPAGIAQAAALARLRAHAEALAATPVGDLESERAAEADVSAGSGTVPAIARFDAAAAHASPGEAASDTADEADGGGLEHDLSLVRASLAAAAPAVAVDLDKALAALSAPADEEDAPGAALVAVAAAATALAPVGATTPDRTAALIAELLLDEGGVAESYEAAVAGEGEAYASGWAALQHVKALWRPLRTGAGAPAADIDASLARLDALFPAAVPMGPLSPDPEEAEEHAQAIVGLLEVATRTDLYPGRDLGTAIGIVEDLAAEGCARRAAGSDDLAAERMAIASAYYARLLAPTLEFVAAEPAAAIAGGFAALEAGGAGDCAALNAALEAARTAVASP